VASLSPLFSAICQNNLLQSVIGYIKVLIIE
jgi:hypothetical protein